LVASCPPTPLFPSFVKLIVVSAEHRSRVNRDGGWLHPVVLYDGRLVATWRTERKPEALRLEINAFTRLSPAVGRGVEIAAGDDSTFLGTQVDLVHELGQPTCRHRN
jgi:Winged helix DNA-binding domain